MLTEADNTLERLCLVMVMDWAESNLLYLIRNHTCDKENQIPAWLQTELDDTKCRYFFLILTIQKVKIALLTTNQIQFFLVMAIQRNQI